MLIDLSQKDILINSDELQAVILRAEPATRAHAYIAQFKPPPAHICTWLNANPQSAQSYAIFAQYARQERLACT